jgi:hypothetical protein
MRKVENFVVLLTSLRLQPQLPIPIYCDNAATVLAGTTPSARKSRHLAIAIAYIREQIHDGNVKLQQINTNENISDLFTKVLPVEKFELFRSYLMDGVPFIPNVITQQM